MQTSMYVYIYTHLCKARCYYCRRLIILEQSCAIHIDIFGRRPNFPKHATTIRFAGIYFFFLFIFSIDCLLLFYQQESQSASRDCGCNNSIHTLLKLFYALWIQSASKAFFLSSHSFLTIDSPNFILLFLDAEDQSDNCVITIFFQARSV